LNQELATSDVVVEDQDTEIVLKRLIAALPDGERKVIEHVLAGFTQMETATALGISLSTVKRLEKSAMAWMRSQAR
jgi:RNA polymerase sigma factor (sigma-70 family)